MDPARPAGHICARGATIRRQLINVATHIARHVRGHITVHVPQVWHPPARLDDPRGRLRAARSHRLTRSPRSHGPQRPPAGSPQAKTRTSRRTRQQRQYRTRKDPSIIALATTENQTPEFTRWIEA